MKRILLGLWLVVGLGVGLASAATLLPNGKQVFVDQNGQPLAGGSVSMFIPNTMTPKTTWQDAGQSQTNTNPILLDSSGSAVIYGNGSYRQIVKDVFGVTIWDQPTADPSGAGVQFWAGTAGGSGNAIAISDPDFSSQDGHIIYLRGSATNTGATTVSVNGGAGIAVVKDTLNGPMPLTGGEITNTDIAGILYDASLGQFHLITGVAVNPVSTLASAASVDLGAVGNRNVNVTGVASITSFGSSAKTAQPIYFVTFAGGATVVYNATSMVTPGAKDIVTSANSLMVLKYLGSGNWQVLSYSGDSRVALTQNTTYYVRTAPQTVTISLASPAVVSWTGHGLQIGDPVVFNTTGALYTPLVAGTTYYVIAAGFGANSFEVSTTPGGAAVNTSGSQSGTQSAQTGNDSNPGTSQTRTGAWLTVQAAVNYILGNVDFRGKQLTLQLADGAYTGGFTVAGPTVGQASATDFTIQGNVATPANVLISNNTTNIVIQGYAQVRLRGFKTTISAGNGELFITQGAIVNYDNIEFGTAAAGTGYQVWVSDHGIVVPGAGIVISGGGSFHMILDGGAAGFWFNTTTTLVGTVTYSGAVSGFMGVQIGSVMESSGVTFNCSGCAASGNRFYIQANAVLSDGGSATYWPGNAPGVAVTGAQHI